MKQTLSSADPIKRHSINFILNNRKQHKSTVIYNLYKEENCNEIEIVKLCIETS